jgi:integrating conjugative element protein (TIGR03757 family)
MSRLNFINPALLFALHLPLATAADAPLVVTYIGTNDHPTVNAGVAKAYSVTLSMYNIDAHRNLEKQLSADLPRNFAEAEKLANERLKAMDGKVVQEAFKGVALTIQWDLKKVPAIVFGDGEQVIYGVTDLDEALKRYSFYRSRTR